jgi:hypothetical protein
LANRSRPSTSTYHYELNYTPPRADADSPADEDHGPGRQRRSFAEVTLVPHLVWCLELLVYADRLLEHRVGLLALVANGLEHACGQRIELALDGSLGP